MNAERAHQTTVWRILEIVLFTVAFVAALPFLALIYSIATWPAPRQVIGPAVPVVLPIDDPHHGEFGYADLPLELTRGGDGHTLMRDTLSAYAHCGEQLPAILTDVLFTSVDRHTPVALLDVGPGCQLIVPEDARVDATSDGWPVGNRATDLHLAPARPQHVRVEDRRVVFTVDGVAVVATGDAAWRVLEAVRAGTVLPAIDVAPEETQLVLPRPDLFFKSPSAYASIAPDRAHALRGATADPRVPASSDRPSP